MGFNKKFFTTGGIVASTPPAEAAFDPLQNFETVLYTGNGSTKKVNGYIRKGAAFNGSSSYIDTNYTLPTDSTMTFSFWVNVSAFGAGDTYIISDLSSSATDRRLDFRFNSSGHFVVDVGNGSSSDAGNTDGVVQSTNTWIHFVVVLNGTSLKVYKDGNSTPIVDETLTVAFGTAGVRSLNLGRAGDYNGAYFNGKIDQFRIFNTAITDTSKISQLAAEDYSKATKSTTDIFGDGSGVALYEFEENANDTGGTYNGTATNVDFLGMQFSPDFVWAKSRGSGSHVLTDSVRGDGEEIYSDLPNAEGTVNRVALNSNGFTVTTSGYLNSNGVNHVAWCWKAGGAVTLNNNTNGTTNSTVSANQDAGFSIVKFPVTATSINVGHGLSSAPEMIFYKNLDAVDSWYVYHKDLSSPNTQYLNLDTSGAATTNASNNFSSVGATTFTTFLSGVSADIICYCFHSVDGYQKVGYFNQTSGTSTVSTGFRPRFLMMKRSDDTGNWFMYTSLINDGDKQILADENYAEADTSGYTMAFNDDGFVLTIAAGTYDVDYIYLAIA